MTIDQRMTEAEIAANARPADALFPGRQDAQRNASCAFNPLHVADTFRDELSAKEYRISGLCQACQDDFYGA